MHAAWQEHASALLRELLLVQLDDEPDAFERHAEASDALNVLYEQIPVPELDEDPDALMATAIEPDVSEEALAVLVPRTSVPHFDTLHELLVRGDGGSVRGPVPRAHHAAGDPGAPCLAVPAGARPGARPDGAGAVARAHGRLAAHRAPRPPRLGPPRRLDLAARAAGHGRGERRDRREPGRAGVPRVPRRERARRPAGHHDHPAPLPPGPHRRDDPAHDQRAEPPAGDPRHRPRGAGRRQRGPRGARDQPAPHGRPQGLRGRVLPRPAAGTSRRVSRRPRRRRSGSRRHRARGGGGVPPARCPRHPRCR